MNLKRLQRYYHTIKHLKRRQIAYQLHYRIRRAFPRKIKPAPLHLKRLVYQDYQLILSTGKFHPPFTFTFLNQTKKFEDSIDWSFSGYGKLWNYNLQYFDYLHDPAVEENRAIALIEECSEKILSGKLMLEPYPVSLRLINWLLYHSRTGYSSDLFQKAISLQIQYLWKHREYHIDGNHLLENYVAIFICSLYTGQRAPENISKLFTEEAKNQVLADGSHIECSPMYHCIILSKICMVYALLIQNEMKEEAVEKLGQIIQQMLGWLAAYQYSDGSLALFNDAAPEISVTSEVLSDFALKYNIPVISQKLTESGYRKFNGSFGEVVVDVGNILPSYQPGHAHSDMLSLTLFAKGKEWLFDPGVSTYEKNRKRDLERSTMYHNTVTIDDENQSDVWGGFRVGHRARVTIETDEPKVLIASHDGYLNQFGCIHRRKFSFTDLLEITDELTWVKGKMHKATARLYLDGRVEQIDEGSFHVDETIKIIVSGFTHIQISEIDVPDGFNKYKKAKRLSATFEKKLTTTIRLL